MGAVRAGWLFAALVWSFGVSWGAPSGARAQAGRGTPTGQHPPAVEAQVDSLMRTGVHLLYETHLVEANRVSQALQRLAPRDPRTPLLEARILREVYPDQSTGNGNLSARAAPMHAQLDHAVELADSLIGVDPSNVGGHLYRGWAYLFKAQLYALSDEYWNAGRAAKNGKGALDRTLELDPGNTDAKGVLGTYLYFADVLPRVVKILRTIVRVPGGDRQLGIELLQASAEGHGYNRLDARALIGAIEFAFEGDYEVGAAAFESLLSDFPDNPRILEPIAAMNLVRPQAGTIGRVARVAALYAADPADWYRQMSQRLTFYQALSEAMEGHIDEARAHLEEVHARAPTEPSWFPGDVMLCLSEMHLLVGDQRRALELHASVERVPRLEERLRFVRESDAAATPAEARTFRSAQEAARALYAGDLATARRHLEALAPVADPAVHYYKGEWARLQGDFAHAALAYRRVTEQRWPRRWRLYKVLAYSRLAEIQAAQGMPQNAASTLEDALVYDEDRDLLRHLLRARKRFFETMAENGFERPFLPAGMTTVTRDGESH